MTTTGTVEFFDEQRGFGFISPAEGEDVFVHVSNLAGGLTTLSAGQRVVFETRPGRKGPEAIDVRPG